MSFIDITQSQIVSAHISNQFSSQGTAGNGQQHTSEISSDNSLSTQLARYEQLYAVLSSRSDIDHPICAECASILVAGFSTKLANATRERDAYALFLKTLQQAANKHQDDGGAVQKELESLRREEEEAYRQLLTLEQEKKELEDELAGLEDENRELEREEDNFWRSRNEFNEQHFTLQTELASLQQKLAHDQKQLERLQRTNVYNDTFYISHDGYFGTINGLRLGRLPSQNVEWAEINAAWGQTLLLLQTIAERLNFSFEGYRLRPLGSTSRIEKLEYTQQSPEVSRVGASHVPSTTSSSPSRVVPLDLHSSGEMALGRVFNHRKFDQGMVAFLACLSQIGQYVERSSRDGSTTGTSRGSSATVARKPGPSLQLPYIIEGDKIYSRDSSDESVSIKLGAGFSQDENFTKACKYVLTCCKYLLAHVSNMESSRAN